jgi:hypothetical protein
MTVTKIVTARLLALAQYLGATLLVVGLACVDLGWCRALGGPTRSTAQEIRAFWY